MVFVLVHGAWHGGWCYKRVAALLRAAGHEVYVPTLTGLGERSHLMNRSVNLDTHIHDVVNLIRWEELNDIVLCGHSYGGMVVTGVAAKVPDKSRAMVYLDAFVPEDGQALTDFLPVEVRAGLRDDAEKNGDGYLMTPIPAVAFNVNRNDRAWADQMCVKHPLACFEDKVASGNVLDRIAKKTYILATDWPPPEAPGMPSPFVPVAERLRKDSRWRMVAMPCGHDVMLDMPKELAEALIAAA